MIVLTVLAALGFEALRRQSAAEFPEAAGGTFTASVRGRLASVPGTGGGSDSDVRRIERLAALRSQGALSDEEFEALKRPLLE